MKKNKKNFGWMWWLGLGGLIALASFVFSVKSYLLSMNRSEVEIAQVSTSGGNPTNLTATENGKLKVYLIGGYVKQIQASFNFGGGSETVLVSNGIGSFKKTEYEMKKGAKASVTVTINGKSFKNWISPEDSRCIANAGVDYGTIKGRGESILVAQCWDDDGAGQKYNEMVVVVTQDGEGVGTTTTTASSEVLEIGTVTEDPTSFVIRKFLDVNKDGVREVGEGMTNREWVYEYKINNGGKQLYTIEPGQEMGEEIRVTKDDLVRVEERGQEGWLNTTGAVVERSLREEKLHYFNFGGYPVNGLVQKNGTTNFPATQPKTGTPLGLTLGALGVGVGLLVLKKKFK